MTDDIVNRLREKYQAQLPICAEAADEIERLRNAYNTVLLHLQCVSLYRGTNTANAVLDYYKPSDNNLDWSTITITTEQDN